MATSRPIIFSAPMIRAILDGRKTQTRRIVKYIPAFGYPNEWCKKINTESFNQIVGDYTDYCPYGKPGDKLWVRETFCADFLPFIYRATATSENYGKEKIKWRPSIHMPRIYSRITLEIVSVRVERLQDISEADAIAEGVESRRIRIGNSVHSNLEYQMNARLPFIELWNSINGKKEGCSWEASPFVWVVEFKRVEASQ